MSVIIAVNTGTLIPTPLTQTGLQSSPCYFTFYFIYYWFLLTVIILLQSHHSGALNIIAAPGPEACFNVQPGKTLKILNSSLWFTHQFSFCK